LNFIPYIKDENYPKLTDVKGEAGENGSIVWEIKKHTDSDLTIEEMRRLPGKNPNFQRAKDVKRLIKEGLKCAQIVQVLRSKYSERSVKGDHAALRKSPTLKK
jgi:hypothetical protein